MNKSSWVDKKGFRIAASIVFGILFYVGGEVGKIKALLFLAGFALVFVLLMKFSLH